MALINQAGMYNGSANLNPLPYVQIAIQARQRNAAREEALDKYYRTLPDTLNDKNIRDIEVPIIEGIKKELFEYGIKHRDALKKGDGAAKLGLDQIFRKGQSVARLSQDAAKKDLQAGKFFLEKNNQYALNNDSYIKEHEASQLPVTDPNHKSVDLQKYAANRPFDELSFVKDIKTKFPYSEKAVRTPDPSDPNYEFVTTIPVLDEKSKIQMVSDAADRFHNDPTFRKKIQKDLAGTGQLPALVQIAKEQFGVKDPTDISDEILAAANTYSKMPVGKTRDRVQANYTNRQAGKMDDWRTKFEAANGEWDRRRPLKFADSLALIQARNDAGGNTEDYDAGYITDDYFKKYGKTLELKDAGWVVNGVMKGEEPAGFVPVSSIHPSDINLINGFDKEKKQLAVNPIEVNGVKGYIVKKDGDWVGDNGLIPRDRVRARNIETRMNTKFKKNEQNTKKGFNTPKGKTETKSTGKWDKYKVN